MADKHDCASCDIGLEEKAVHTFFHCDLVPALWEFIGYVTARISPKQFEQLDVAYVIDSIDPPWLSMKQRAFGDPIRGSNGDPDDAIKGIV